jgi:hypothetical protein
MSEWSWLEVNSPIMQTHAAIVASEFVRGIVARIIFFMLPVLLRSFLLDVTNHRWRSEPAEKTTPPNASAVADPVVDCFHVGTPRRTMTPKRGSEVNGNREKYDIYQKKW